MNITLKYSQDTALAWVTDLDSGAPVADVPVIFYNSDFNPIAQVTTDADGLAMAEIPHLTRSLQDHVRDGETDGGISAMRSAIGAMGWIPGSSTSTATTSRKISRSISTPIARSTVPISLSTSRALSAIATM